MKKKLLVGMLAGMAVLLLGCARAQAAEIVTTSFPCYDFARQIAGDAAQVRMLIRPGTEVHSYEPTPADILAIGDSDLFVAIGGESDAWIDGILGSMGGGAPRSIFLMDSVEALEEEEVEGDEHHHETELDEHIWTSPKNALKMLRALETAMCEAIPGQAEAFHANADAYAAQIADIDARLTEMIGNAKRREVIFADRFPFLYLAHDYGLTYEAAFSSCTSETEPSAQTLVRLIRAIQADGIPAVYTIEMSNGAIARTLAEETGVEILSMHSAQTVTQAEFDAGESYVSLMEKNLAALERGLNE